MKRFLNELQEYIYAIKKWKVILIFLYLAVIPSCAGYHAYVTSGNLIANEQKKQEELKEKQAADDITVKYKSALQAKNQKDWNKVVATLNTIDMDMVRNNTEAFKAKYEISSDKELIGAIAEEKRKKTSFASEEKKKKIEAQYNELLKNKPITSSQINILKRFAEGMIEFETGNYEKAYDIFSIHDVYESEIAKEYLNIRNETRRILTVKVPVKVIDAICIMKYDSTFNTEIPYFTITIENPLDEPIYIANLSERAVDKYGESAHYSYPYEYERKVNLSLDIPARDRVTYKFRGSVFLHNIKYYLLGVADFYMKNSKKRFTECEKFSEPDYFKVEAKY